MRQRRFEGGPIMGASTPQELHRLAEKAFNEQDLDSAMATYEPGAVHRPLPGVVVSGTEAGRELLGRFLSMKPTVRLEATYVFEAGDIALLCSRWTASGTDPEGNDFDLSGEGTEVARRQPDGMWLTVIDNAYGTAHLDALAKE
jgi:ketosteroid isomerase-like protein